MKLVLTSMTFDDISPSYVPVADLSWIADFLNAIEVPGTFFVVPNTKVDSQSEQEFSTCLKKILDLGHETSLHGYKHVKNEFGYFYPVPIPIIPIPSFDEQREQLVLGLKALVRLSGSMPFGFRSPFYLYNRLTLQALSSLDFKYDSSTTVFKPTHATRFRIGWSMKFGPYLTQGLTEIPVTGDYTYNLNSSNFLSSLRRSLRDFELIKSRKGSFVINFHMNRLNRRLLGEFIKAIVENLRDRTEFVRLVELCMKS